MILDNEFTGDLRVENEVIALQKENHEVFVLALNYGDKKRQENFSGATIFRISIYLFVKKKLRGLNNTIFDLYPAFWVKRIKKFIWQNKIDVLHVHDLWMLDSAYKANKDFNLPVIADLHENFVDALSHYKYTNTFLGKILISVKRWRQSEIEWTNKADNIITVIEEAVERYQTLGIKEGKISVVANYVNYENFLAYPIDDLLVKRFSNKFIATYIGGFDSHRGLESVIKSMPQIVREIKNFHLILVGKGSNYEDLVNLANTLQVSSYISFEGWQLTNILSSYIKASSLCLIPHLKTAHTDNTIPHKLFQYMILEKPVVASNCDPIKRIIDETQAGVIYESNNEVDLAEKIIHLYKNPELQLEMGRRGKKAVMEKYNWYETSRELISLYSNLESKKENG
ncbi:MAG: glycosyltransferase family 4 protein [Bacteroidetes bacterium]|nr:glycosyltransferase family 4 protein [Patescibacteria group bacterium]MBU1677521.1 glycosyltransferase family 4 protein [Bacteroidota bacterium]